jgi:hypothetical protein
MTAQLRKTAASGAELLNGENGGRQISDCPLLSKGDAGKRNSSHRAVFFGY